MAFGPTVPMTPRRLLLAALLAGIASASTAARGETPPTALRDQSWPQWRGPICTGTSTTAHPPVEWSETKNIKWKVAIPGSGSATPIIWGDKIFIQTAIPTGKKIEAQAAASDSKDPQA